MIISSSSHVLISLSLQPEFVPIFNVDNLKIPNNVLSVLRVYTLPMVTCVLLLHELVSAANVGPSLHLLPSRLTRPACCPPFSTSIISTPVGWAGRRAIGGCSSPRRWNSLRPSTIASEAEQPPVWADCGEGAGRFRDFPTNCSLCTAFKKPGPSPDHSLYSLYITRDFRRLLNIYYCMYVDKSRF